MSRPPESAQQDSAAPPRIHRPHHHSLHYRIMKFIRRTHTYTGIFMTPLLLMYGISGFLFNHPRRFPTEGARAVDAPFPGEVYDGSRLAAIPPPAELAGQVLGALNARPGQKEKFSPTPANAHYANYFMLNGESGGGRYNLQLDLNSRRGVYHLFAPAGHENESAQKSLGKVDAITLDQPWLRGLQEDLRRLTASTGQPLRTAAPGPMLPELAFQAEAGGKTWDLRYRLGNGTVMVNDTPWKQKVIFFFRRMHLAASYQPFSWLRTVWAVQVDLVCALLCGWALSGLIIWWQMKNLRRWGLVTVVLAAVYFAIVGLGMYRLLL